MVLGPVRLDRVPALVAALVRQRTAESAPTGPVPGDPRTKKASSHLMRRKRGLVGAVTQQAVDAYGGRKQGKTKNHVRPGKQGR